MSGYVERWQRELSVFCGLSSTIVMTGNVCDRVPVYAGESLRELPTMDEYLCQVMRARGCRSILQYDLVNGFSDAEQASEKSGIDLLTELLKQESQNTTGGQRQGENAPYTVTAYGNKRFLRPAGLETAAHIIQLLLQFSPVSVGILCRFASLLTARPDDLDQEERRAFLALRTAGESAGKKRDGSGTVVQNQLILLADKLNDLPVWFTMEFPQLKVIQVERPNAQAREAFVKVMLPYFEGGNTATEQIRRKYTDTFVGQTDGLTYCDLNNIRMIAARQHLSAGDVEKAIMLYRHGVQENPWTQLERCELANLEKRLSSRVRGQAPVIRQAVDVLKRAITGMSGLQHSSGSRPRGVLFLAGPTGTGKTELAKAITECIFRDERNLIRFDMSEYQQPQSDQRLLGAPPGYVGYEAGGQLTNAVREHPFSVLLFDEIEKAHPSLMDKFLQILDDGRITDGRGDTVYFQHCVIIFTSNLGMTRPSETEPGVEVPNVLFEQDRDYAVVKAKIEAGVRRYFTEKLNRPELLNRIGNNILVFDFIREDAMTQILEKQISGIRQRLADEHHIHLQLSAEASRKLTEFGREQLSKGQGGRGIGNMVEEKLLNPLARFVFDNNVSEGDSILVQDIETDGYGLPAVKAVFGRH